ncbi:MAG: hypothetical protein WCS31_01895 [Verrucomicrobiae bacterium]
MKALIATLVFATTVLHADELAEDISSIERNIDTATRKREVNAQDASRDREEMKKSLQSIDLQTYFARMDKLEEAHPYDAPRLPKIIDDPREYYRNQAKLDDYDERLVRYNERMADRKSKSEAESATEPIAESQSLDDLLAMPITEKSKPEAESAPAPTPAPQSAEIKEVQFKAAVEKSRVDVTRCFPQSLEKEHPLHAKAAELWKMMEDQDNPIVSNSDAPFIVYSMAAAMLGIKPIMQR